MSRARTSIVMGAFRARQFAAIVEPRGDEILTVDDMYRVAVDAGMRRQAAEHAVDVLLDGFEGHRLVDDEHGRPRIMREGGR